MIRNFVFARSPLALVLLLLLAASLATAVSASKMQVVPKWGRFEQAFKSGVVYSNSVQDVSLKVTFTSPLGEACEVDGFWDGGRTWRVRFSPNQPGRWQFKTACSDTSNIGLHNEAGEFLCSAAIGHNRFHQHGPVRVARDHRHLEHADATPFFWLADTAWNGACVADQKDWEFYALTRARQGFTVVQWAAAPGQDGKKQAAWTGRPERIVINPDFFKRLDAELDTLTRAGILSAIAPLWEIKSQTNAAPLPDDQAELLVRYVVARWGAEPVAWLVAFEGDASAGNVGRWKRIGQAVFGGRSHAPVVLFPGETQWLFDEFRDQPWVDVFGYQTVADVTDDALKWVVAGPLAAEWKKEPARPLISYAPCENGVVQNSGKRFTADDVRRAAYWSLLLAPSAGLSYSGQGVATWETAVEPKGAKGSKGTELPLWHKALFMPGAKQMAHLEKFMSAIDYWTLRPQAKAVAVQPGNESPRRFVAAASTVSNTLSVVYVPEDRTLELNLDALPPSPSVGWFNPRTGGNNPAVAVVSGRACQFPTPDPGDWLLLLKAGK